MEPEQVENIEEARIASLLDSEGWQLVRKKLVDYIETIESVKTLPNGSNEQVGEEAKVRARVIQTLLIWLNDIESIREARQQNSELPPQDDYIRFYE